MGSKVSTDRKVLIALMVILGMFQLLPRATPQNNTKGVYFQATAPATCNVGEVWCDTDDGTFSTCTSSNTWTASGGAPTSAQYVTLATSASLSAERVLTGTSNQVVVTDGGANGNATLSLPQSIHTSGTPQFAALGLGTAAGSAGLLQLVGGGSGTSTLYGVLNKNITPVGNVGGGTDDLMSYTLPASSLNANGMGFKVIGYGTLAANGNTKTVSIQFGSTVIGSEANSTNNGNFYGEATVMRTGATSLVATGWVNFHLNAGGYDTEKRNYTAVTETLSNALAIKFTAVGTSDNDISQKAMVVTAFQ